MAWPTEADITMEPWDGGSSSRDSQGNKHGCFKTKMWGRKILLMVRKSGIYQLRLVVYPLICRVSDMLGSARCLPLTVCLPSTRAVLTIKNHVSFNCNLSYDLHQIFYGILIFGSVFLTQKKCVAEKKANFSAWKPFLLAKKNMNSSGEIRRNPDLCSSLHTHI